MYVSDLRDAVSLALLSTREDLVAVVLGLLLLLGVARSASISSTISAVAMSDSFLKRSHKHMLKLTGFD